MGMRFKQASVGADMLCLQAVSGRVEMSQGTVFTRLLVAVLDYLFLRLSNGMCCVLHKVCYKCNRLLVYALHGQD
jgi:hypothetical protein